MTDVVPPLAASSSPRPADPTGTGGDFVDDPGDEGAALAALPPPAALRALAEELPGARQRRAILRAAERVDAGADPAAALAAVRGELPAELAALLDVPALGGGLPAALTAAASAEAGRTEDRRRLRWAFGWPLVLAALTAVGAAAAVTFISTLAGPVYEEFGVSVPALTQALLTIGGAIAAWWPALLGLAAAILAGAAYLLMGPRPGGPFAAPLLRPGEQARWCELLAVLIDARTPLPDALRASAEGVADPRLRRHLALLGDTAEDGVPPADAARMNPRLPPALRAALRWADRPEAFADALRGAAAVLRAAGRDRLAPAGLLGVALQPALVLFAALAMGLGIISLIWPLLDLLGALS